ncbi:MAG TPA: FecR domain-containing protein [Myxococcota bacterium]|nr:FecR domain-containing protein [Myxococcota bacterium]HRY94696.1 FecR domain-containing protein [Myxococcota bacterium]HSA20266.1 FecR domain-containing protein [Myxococcota bacterium]
MEKIRLSCVCLLLAALAGCPGGEDEPGGQDAAVVQPWARVTKRLGQVEVRDTDAGVWRPAVVGVPLLETASLRTGPDGTAKVEFRDGRQLDLQPDSQLDLAGSGGEAELQLQAGEVVVDSSTEGGGFRIRFGEAREVVRLQSGQARVRRVEGGDLEVKAAQGASSGFRLKFGDDSGVVVARDGNARLSAAASGTQIRMVMGDATLERGGQTTALREGASFQMRVGEGEVVRREALPTRVKGVKGGLRMKLPGEADFKLVAAAGPLEPGATVRSAKPYSLEDGAGGKVELSPGSEVVFGGAFREGGVRQGTLKLESGQARVRLERGSAAGSAQAVETTYATVTARARGGQADVTVMRKADGTQVEVRSGEAEVKTSSETISLLAGESLSVDTAGKLGKPVREPMPRIVAVEGAHTQVFYDRWIPRVAFALARAEDGAQATVEVGPKADFAKVWAREPALRGYLAQNARAGRSFFRVLRPEEGKPQPLPGPVGSLELSPDPVATAGGAASVNNVVPDTGVQTRILFQGKVPRLTFQWEEHPGAAGYVVRVYAEDDLETPQIEERTAERKLALAPGRLREGTYYWYQAALDASGKLLKSNQMNKLVLVFDNAATLMRIDAPRPGERPADGRIEVRGRAPVGASVSVNGKEILVADDGRFEQVLADIAPGSLLLFQLKRPGQGPVFYTRHLGK